MPLNRIVNRIRLAVGPARRVIANGCKMRIDPRDWMDRAFFDGSYSVALARIIPAVARTGDHCIDVGAQKGYFALQMARAVGPNGVVVALEPDPRAASALIENIRANSFENTHVFTVAASDTEGLCELNLSTQIGWSTRFPNGAAKPSIFSTCRVPTQRVDTLIASYHIPLKPRLLKIDAEGSEALVLQGATTVLSRERPVVCLEINRGSLAAAGSSPRVIEDLLRSHHYRFYQISEDNFSVRPIQSFALAGSNCFDVVAVHDTDSFAPM